MVSPESLSKETPCQPTGSLGALVPRLMSQCACTRPNRDQCEWLFLMSNCRRLGEGCQASTPVALLRPEGQSSRLACLSCPNSFGVRLCSSQDGTSLQVSPKWDTWGAREATAQAEDNWDMLPGSGAPQQPQAKPGLQKRGFLPLRAQAPAPIVVTRHSVALL